MTLGLLCAALSGVMNSFLPYVFRLQGPEVDRQAGLHIVGLGIGGAVAAALVVALGLPVGGWKFIAISCVAGVCLTANGFAYFGIVVHRGPLAISWAIVWMSVVLLSIVGWVFLKEPVRLGQPFGLVCFVACLVTMGIASHRTSRSKGGALAPQKGFWAWMIFGLATVTVGNLLMKVKELAPPVGHSLSFVIFRCLVGATMLWVVGRLFGVKPTFDRRTRRVGLLFGLLFLVNLYLMLEGVKRLDVSVAFPVIAGSAVLTGETITVLTGERPSKLAYLGAAFAVAAVLLVNVG